MAATPGTPVACFPSGSDSAEASFVMDFAAEGVNRENAFMQVNRLLSGNTDKAANLRVIRRLAAKHPQLAQAHFAVAQAAAVAADDNAALAAVREAQALRPDWELAALLEAQVLQKRSPAEAAKRLREFVEKNPSSREARLSYARMLALDKRFAEARQQFEAVAGANPANPEVIYAVGLLAYQLKDYPAAETYMKRVLGLGYRDPEGVRYLLGQIAEEQKLSFKIVRPSTVTATRSPSAESRSRPVGPSAGCEHPAGRFSQPRGQSTRRLDGMLTFIAALLGLGVGAVIAAALLLVLRFGVKAVVPDFAGFAVGMMSSFAALAAIADGGDPVVVEHAPRSREQIVEDVLEAVADEIHRLLEEGVVAEAADVDTCLLLGAGFMARGITNQILHSARGMGLVAIYNRTDLSLIGQDDLESFVETDPEIAAHLGEVLWKAGQRDEARKVWRAALTDNPDHETLTAVMQKFRP